MGCDAERKITGQINKLFSSLTVQVNGAKCFWGITGCCFGEKFSVMCRIWNFADVVIDMGFNAVYSGRENCCIHFHSAVYRCLSKVDHSLILLYSLPLVLCLRSCARKTETPVTLKSPRTKLHTFLGNKTIILVQARERKVLQAEVHLYWSMMMWKCIQFNILLPSTPRSRDWFLSLKFLE